jgi:uncharacterized protein YndB with AHSA1/START domain
MNLDSVLTRVSAIRVGHRFNAPAQRVFDAWFDPAVAGKWLFASALRPMTQVAIDARAGGWFRLASRGNGQAAEHRGRYIEIVPHRRLVFDLVAADRPRVTTRVTVDIAPRRRGCKLTLRHENISADETADAEGRWAGILYGLDQTLAAVPSRKGETQ